MQLKNLFKEKLVSISKKCDFHFSPMTGKKKALAAIKQARIKKVLILVCYI